jgi:hypothetical protein
MAEELNPDPRLNQAQVLDLQSQVLAGRAEGLRLSVGAALAQESPGIMRQLATLAADWMMLAGHTIAAPCSAAEIAARNGTAHAGLLAAAVDLRELLCQSAQGRQALHDLGFQPVGQQVEGE